jgi:hypothetical protein
MNKGDDVYDIPTCCTKFLKYDPFEDQIEDICNVQLDNNPIGVKVQGAFDGIDYLFTFTLGCNSKFV